MVGRVVAAVVLLISIAGCAHRPAGPDLSGRWINRAAIADAVVNGSVRNAVRAHGPVLEWVLDEAHGRAQYDGGGHPGRGTLERTSTGVTITFEGGRRTVLALRDGVLVGAGRTGAEETFVRVQRKLVPDAAPAGAAFVRELQTALLAGSWHDGAADPGADPGTIQFRPDGAVQGLPGVDRYELLLEGDRATSQDAVWLEGRYGDALWAMEHRPDRIVLRTIGGVGTMGRCTPAGQMLVLEPGEQKAQDARPTKAAPQRQRRIAPHSVRSARPMREDAGVHRVDPPPATPAPQRMGPRFLRKVGQTFAKLFRPRSASAVASETR